MIGPYIGVVLLNCSVSCKVGLVAHPTTQVSFSCGSQVYPGMQLLADDHAEDNWDIRRWRTRTACSNKVANRQTMLKIGGHAE